VRRAAKGARVRCRVAIVEGRMSGIVRMVSRWDVDSGEGREWVDGGRGVEVGGDGGGAWRSDQRKLGGRRAGVPMFGSEGSQE